MIEKTLSTGRKVSIRELSIDQIDDLKDIIEVIYMPGGKSTIKNLNKARSAWIRAGLGGGDFKGWKPNGVAPPDNVLRQLTDVEREELFDVIQAAQVMGEEKPSN